MNCDVVKDLLPLYIDGCCSEESEKIVKEHIEVCGDCKKVFEDMSTPTKVEKKEKSPVVFCKLNEWRASVMQSALLFISFALITLGVALEAKTPTGLMNGFWASNLVIPATGFMLSLANWYFVRIYKSRKAFSNASLFATLGITVGAYIWSIFHYGADVMSLFAGQDILVILGIIRQILFLNGMGILLTLVFCILSKVLSDKYAKMLGKE